MKKKAELTTQQIVGLIILITSFAVILFLLFRLNLGEITDKEICHNSVVMKGKTVLGGSLDCKTNYVCISGGGECQDFNPTITIEVNSDNKTQIMKAIADEMADCWWMFGEGKVDYIDLNAESVTIGKINCVLCSIISFDEKIKNDENLKKEKINYKEFYEEYLKSFKKNGKNYLYYMYNTNDIEDLGLTNADELLEFESQYAVLTGIADQGFLKKTGSFFFSGFDFFNEVFVSFLNLPKLADYKNYGPIPVTIMKKEDINKLQCDEFITKA